MRRNGSRPSPQQLNQIITVSAQLLAALFLLPLLTASPATPAPPEPEEEPVDRPEPPAPFISGSLDSARPLRVLDGENVLEMDLGEYLLGVVRAEMPAAFEPEALKAQTTAARTYTLYKLQTDGNHGETADICTNPACCQAYISEEQARTNWGENADAYETKIETAVKETDGQTILYGGVPILAVFHSSSAGLTRAAGAVWVNDLPYLQAVSSPEAGDQIPNYYSRVEFTPEELKQKLLAAFPEADLSGGMSSWLRAAERDSAGSIVTASAGGVTVKGTQLRTALGLRSACFTWEEEGGKMVFFVTGYGHGVGLSQYGANQMALDGADYQEILTHYYSGVTIEPYPA